MRLSVGGKFLGFVAISSILFASTSGVSMVLNRRTNNSFTSTMNTNVSLLQRTAQIRYYMDHEVSLLRSVLINEQIGDTTEAKSDFATFKQMHTGLQQDIQYELKHESDDGTRKDLTTIGNTENQFANQVIQLLGAPNPDPLTLMQSTVPLIHTGVVNTNTVTKVINEQTQEILANNAAQDKQVQRNDLWMSLIQLAFIILTILLGIYLTHLLSSAVKSLVALMKRVEEGDLTVEDEGKRTDDEIGDAHDSLIAMVKNLKTIIHKALDGASQLASSSEELSASAEETTRAVEQVSNAVQDLNGEVSNQNRDIESSVATLGEITQGVQHIAQNSQDASHQAHETAEVANNGSQTVSDAVGQMNTIEQSVTALAEDVEALQKRSTQISDIVKVIRDISSQTALLALNASIEAARAGEAGRGFAVVAEEVRKLAEESAKSATQIDDLVKTIHQEMQKTTETMKSTLQEVNSGSDKVKVAGDAFERILKSVQITGTKVEEISAAVQEITASAEEVNGAFQNIARGSEQEAQRIQQISRSTEEQLATMEEITASSDSLAKLADELQQSVSIFTV